MLSSSGDSILVLLCTDCNWFNTSSVLHYGSYLLKISGTVPFLVKIVLFSPHLLRFFKSYILNFIKLFSKTDLEISFLDVLSLVLIAKYTRLEINSIAPISFYTLKQFKMGIICCLKVWYNLWTLDFLFQLILWLLVCSFSLFFLNQFWSFLLSRKTVHFI